MDEIKSVIRECDQRMIAIVKDSNEVLLEEVKNNCKGFGYRLNECEYLKVKIHPMIPSKPTTTLRNRQRVLKQLNP
jgi:hypothetical protein